MKTINKKIVMLVVWTILGSVSLWANNIQITKGPQIVSRDQAAQQISVRFDMSWDNSWNLNFPKNWDAAWVFMKYKVASNVGSDFKHAYLVKANNIVKGSGSTPSAQSYGTSTLATGVVKTTGVFLYRKDIGSGKTEFKDVELVWDTKETGIDTNTVLSIRIFAMEMVYVPQGGFEVGDNSSYGRLQVYNNIIFDKTRSAPTLSNNNANIILPNSIVPRMTGPTTPSGYAVTSSSVSGGSPYNQFNYRDPVQYGYYWYYNATTWHWVQIQLPSAVKATWGHFMYYHGDAHAGNTSNYTPYGFYIMGSNDNATWYNVHGTTSTNWAENANLLRSYPGNNTTLIKFDNPDTYRYYRFYYYGYQIHLGNIQIFSTNQNNINRINSENELQFYIREFQSTDYGQYPNNASYVDPVPAAWPKGYKAFYCMKHELTQAAWVDFLNSLSISQQKNLSFIAPTSAKGTNLFSPYYAATAHRMTIQMREPASQKPAVYGCSLNGSDWDHEKNGGNVPMFGLAWTDIVAYLDWACLRPMTELEYEKACRGDQKPIPREYAWGSATGTRATSTKNANLPDEIPQPATANFAAIVNYNGTVSGHAAGYKAYWPQRAGSFANEESMRVDAGASYWGILNLSDNVPERVINICTVEGRAFTGEHGGGDLTGNGFADVPGWPSQGIPGRTFAYSNRLAQGTGYRGIAVYGNKTLTGIEPVSARRFIAPENVNQTIDISWQWAWLSYSDGNDRDYWTGLRGVHTAQ